MPGWSGSVGCGSRFVGNIPTPGRVLVRPFFLAFCSWVLFIVGAHFVPLGRLFRIDSLVVVGILVIMVSVGAAIAGLLGTIAPTAIAGGVGGVLLILFGAWSLR